MPAAARQTSHKEFLQNQEEFFISVNEQKKNSSKRTFHLNTLLLCWFGAEKPEPGCSGERHGNLLQLLSTVSAIFWESAAC